MNRKPSVVFIDTTPWESFAALAGALRVRGVDVERISAEPADTTTRILQQVDKPLYGRTRKLFRQVDRHDGSASSFVIDIDELPALIPDNAVDVQVQDHLANAVAGAPSPLLDDSHRLGEGVPAGVLSNKIALAASCARAGVPSPRMWSGPGDHLTFPVVVKASGRFDGHGAQIARNSAELSKSWVYLTEHSGTEPFLQEHIEGQVIATGGVAKDGEMIVGVAFDFFPDVSDPHGPSAMAAPIRNDPAVELTRAFIREIGYTGFFRAQWVLTADGTPMLIDFNARPFGCWPALQAAGADFVGAYLYSLDLGPQPEPSQIAYGRIESVLNIRKDGGAGGLKAQRRQALGIIKARRAWLGNRWANVERVKLEMSVGIRRRMSG